MYRFVHKLSHRTHIIHLGYTTQVLFDSGIEKTI